MSRTPETKNKQKKLYRVTTVRDGVDGAIEYCHQVDVIAVDAQQAIRKFWYNLTASATKIQDGEYVDAVVRHAVLPINK